MIGLAQEMTDLQDVLYAQHEHKILIVLQGLDAGGKDGTIRHVFKALNPLGVRVASFKVPTQQELDHDFLWRVHQQVPAKGELVIFNRSHYEDVLAVCVHKRLDQEIIDNRYDHINAFERMLSEEGTQILKFYLHISKDEQAKRLNERWRDPHKNWKFNLQDLQERKLWGRYMTAYEETLTQCDTAWAPWYIIPSDRKWYRNLVISVIIVETLRGLHMQYPKPKIKIPPRIEV